MELSCVQQVEQDAYWGDRIQPHAVQDVAQLPRHNPNPRPVFFFGGVCVVCVCCVGMFSMYAVLRTILPTAGLAGAAACAVVDLSFSKNAALRPMHGGTPLLVEDAQDEAAWNPLEVWFLG